MSLQSCSEAAHKAPIGPTGCLQGKSMRRTATDGIADLNARCSESPYRAAKTCVA